MNLKGEITAFIANELLDGRLVEEDENLLLEGGVDSIGMIRLVAFIQETWQFEVPPDAFTIENFRTVASISAYLENALDGS